MSVQLKRPYRQSIIGRSIYRSSNISLILHPCSCCWLACSFIALVSGVFQQNRKHLHVCVLFPTDWWNTNRISLCQYYNCIWLSCCIRNTIHSRKRILFCLVWDPRERSLKGTNQYTPPLHPTHILFLKKNLYKISSPSICPGRRDTH